MILIADSGSTKTDWCLVEQGKQVKRILTKGINPFFQTTNQIADETGENLFPFISDVELNAVLFYGAGCAFPEKNEIVRLAIASHTNAYIEVSSDLVGAARALCGREAGIACILGTGSNSCFYDGNTITQQVSPLGFILGDEGSGAVLGKLLVGDCLKNQLPPEIKEKFLARFELTPATILDRVYKAPFPNRFLATLSPFLAEHIDVPEIYNLVLNSFNSFFIRNVMQYDYKQYPVHFVGSVACYYRSVLEVAAQKNGVRLGMVMQSPVEGLIQYHSATNNK